MDAVQWMLNQNQGAGVTGGLEKENTFLAYLFLLFIVNRRHPLWLLRVQPTSQILGPGLCCNHLPLISDASGFRVLTGCLVSFIRSCSSCSLSLFPLSRSRHLSGRRIASSLAQEYPDLWVLCNFPCPFNSLQPERRVTDYWWRASECLLANDCYKSW